MNHSRLAPTWVLGLLFFLICLGSGYATLNRYDTRVRGNVDSAHYFNMVTGEPVRHRRADVFRARVLVPTVARAVYPVLRGRVGSWNPVAAALLITNAFFVAGCALLLLLCGRKVTEREDVPLVAALLFLANFAITNLHLAGLVDAGEGFCLMVLTYVALVGRWWGAPFVQVLGATAKETFFPFSLAFLAGWWWATRRTPADRPPVWSLAAATGVGLLSFGLLRRLVLGIWVWPWDVGATMAGDAPVAAALGGTFADQNFWYVFAWLLPLGALGLRHVPRPWAWAAATASVVAITFGAYSHALGGVNRHLFNVTGPLLSMGAAGFLLDGSSPKRKS